MRSVLFLLALNSALDSVEGCSPIIRSEFS